MNTLVLLLLPVALAISPHKRITGGANVNIGDFPFQGSYRNAADTHSCGCVFVGGTWTLTAGHCGGSTSWTAGYGSSQLTGVNPYSIDAITRHPNYDQGFGFRPNDFAVIRTSSRPIGINISPGTIPPNQNNPRGNGAITGWGATCGSCDLSTSLQGAVSIPIISDAECNTLWGSSFNSNVMLCVYNGSQGTCTGDSGGPLSVGSTIYGVASWGAADCVTNFPSVYAKVGAVRDWICSTTGNGAQGC